MKKKICMMSILFLFFSPAVTGFAEEQMTLGEFLGLDRAVKSEICVQCPNVTVTVNKEDFLRAADEIFLTELQDTDAAGGAGFYIFDTSDDELDKYVFISYDGKVSRQNPMLSRVFPAEYKMKESDRKKLCQLLDDEVQKNLNFTRSVRNGLVVGIPVALMGFIGFVIGFCVKRKKGTGEGQS